MDYHHGFYSSHNSKYDNKLVMRSSCEGLHECIDLPKLQSLVGYDNGASFHNVTDITLDRNAK